MSTYTPANSVHATHARATHTHTHTHTHSTWFQKEKLKELWRSGEFTNVNSLVLILNYSYAMVHWEKLKVHGILVFFFQLPINTYLFHKKKYRIMRCWGKNLGHT